MSRPRGVSGRRLARVWPAFFAGLAVSACTSPQPVERIDPAPATSATAPSAPSPNDAGSGAPSTGVSPDDPGVRVSSAGVEAVEARDAESLERGGIPATLRLRGPGQQPIVSTSLSCGRPAQRVLDVPVRRDGLVQLRVTARVVARLVGETDVIALAPRTDLSVLIVRDEKGRVRGRASAIQIDNRWFVREVEACDRATADR